MIKRTEFRKVLKENPILAILRNVEDDCLIDYVKAVIDGGIRFFEVALNSQKAFVQIVRLKEAFGSEILLGAGTVVSKRLAQKAVEAGADFLLSPSTDVEVLSYCMKNEIAFLPGALTPSEVRRCMEYGCSDIKLFPAGEMPASYIKSLKGPLDGTEYIAIGGVNAENIPVFFKNGYIGAGLGSNLMPKEVREKKDWERGTRYIRELIRKVEEVRK